MTIVGDGLIREDLEKLISRPQARRARPSRGRGAARSASFWYSAADLFCLASSREGWPNVILESLACGTPVVATSAGGIPEIIRSDKVGLLVERNETKIAAAIDSALIKQWSAEGLVGYARMHTWERTAANVLRVFESVLEAKNQRAVLDAAVQT